MERTEYRSIYLQIRLLNILPCNSDFRTNVLPQVLDHLVFRHRNNSGIFMVTILGSSHLTHHLNNNPKWLNHHIKEGSGILTRSITCSPTATALSPSFNPVSAHPTPSSSKPEIPPSPLRGLPPPAIHPLITQARGSVLTPLS